MVKSLLVQCPLAQRARVRDSPAVSRTPIGLWWAAAYGDLVIAILLVGKRFDVHVQDPAEDLTALQIAAAYGHAGVIEQLLHSSSKLDALYSHQRIATNLALEFAPRIAFAFGSSSSSRSFSAFHSQTSAHHVSDLTPHIAAENQPVIVELGSPCEVKLDPLSEGDTDSWSKIS